MSSPLSAKKMQKKTVQKNKSKLKSSKPASFDPSKNYQWTPEDTFTLNGVQFDLIYKTVREAALNPVGPSAQTKSMAYDVLQAIFVQGIEEGKIKEVATPDAPK